MMPRLLGKRGLRALALAGVVLAAGAGCMPLVIGGLVAAGGAAGYAYYAGAYHRDYEAGAAEVRLAARTVLQEMGTPVLEEHSDLNGGWVVSTTPTGQRLSVTFNDFPDPNSPSGFVTRVGVRVSAFGDAEFSRSFLDHLATRVRPVPAAPVPPPPGGVPAVPASSAGRLTPQPAAAPESPPPPLAEPKPIPQSSWQKPAK
jgi:hypothetical protein